MVTGLAAVAVPFAVALVVPKKGELGVLVIYFGAVATAFQAVVWFGIFLVVLRLGRARADLAFAAGSWAALLAAVLALNLSRSVAVSGTCYVAVAIVTVSFAGTRRADSSERPNASSKSLPENG